MTKRIFYDTETTGFYKFKSAPSDPDQPRIVQLAWAFDTADRLEHKPEEVTWNDYIVFPDGWVIPTVTSAIHGITTASAQRDGVDIRTVIDVFMEDYEKADEIVAHNLKFDDAIVNSQLVRLGKSMLPQKKTICTMLTTTNILKIPARWGYKWPKLDEAYRFIVDAKGFEGAHNALYDVRACRDVFYTMREKNMFET